MPFSFQPSPCERITSHCLWDFSAYDVWVKRDDLLHPLVSGNKFRKLKYPLLALPLTPVTLVSMGGPWSNHLHALAHAGALLGRQTRGLVRGSPLVGTAMLDDCRRLRMQITFVSREQYRGLRESGDLWRTYFEEKEEQLEWLPEGGSAPEALHGVAELIDELPFIPDTMIVACGTGATLAGLLAGLRGRGRVLGIAVFKNADYLHQEIAWLLQQAGYPAYENYELLTDFHQGGYGKAPPELKQFCRNFTRETTVPTEPVYTGKMFYALNQLALAGKFCKDERIVALHTGGLQGARGYL